jgi:hypothetical protein
MADARRHVHVRQVLPLGRPLPPESMECVVIQPGPVCEFLRLVEPVL